MHGTCNDGKDGDGACTCEANWKGANCDESDADKNCAKGSGKFGADCEPCKCEHGQCNDGKEGDGSCKCEEGWVGDTCYKCDSGYYGKYCKRCSCQHGACNSGPDGDGFCLVCHGNFTGLDCDRCLDSWQGDDCDEPTGCESGFTGDGCTECSANFYGENCTACNSCGLHGSCYDGKEGDGTCNCTPGWDGDDCSECAKDYFGSSCNFCSCKHGTCNDGKEGNGFCSSCHSGWKGRNCDDCESGLFGPNCDQPVTCNNTRRGVASEGVNGNGKCLYCYANFYGLNCENNYDLYNLKIGTGVQERSYKTFTINGRTWMAENAVYHTPSTYTNAVIGYFCDDNNGVKNSKYGCLYTHAMAEKICPAGWRLPLYKELKDLVDYVKSHRTAESDFLALIAHDESWVDYPNEGLDEFGFRIMPAGGGSRTSGSQAPEFGTAAYIWSATPASGHPYTLKIAGGEVKLEAQYNSAWVASVRCIDDKPLICEDDEYPNYEKLTCAKCVKGTAYDSTNCKFLDSRTPTGTSSTEYAVYRIGNQFWLGQNLFAPVGTKNTDHFATQQGSLTAYGYLYTRETANRENICPTGWQLPAVRDFEKLLDYVHDNNNSGKSDFLALIASIANTWKNSQNSSTTYSGADTFGFKAMPAGYHVTGGYLYYGSYARLWAKATADNPAPYLELADGEVSIKDAESNTTDAYSVRCMMYTACEPGEFGSTCEPCTCNMKHGICNDGLKGDGTCSSCFKGWTGENCTDVLPGFLFDERDDKMYRVITVDGTSWMAENLAYQGKDGACRFKDDAYLEQYGCLYNWNDAQEVCPEGWRPPYTTEFDALIYAAAKDNSEGGAGGGGLIITDEMRKIAYNNLRASSWEDGKDTLGFAALPAGDYVPGTNSYNGINSSARFWSALKNDASNGMFLSLHSRDASAQLASGGMTIADSVRCVRVY